MVGAEKSMGSVSYTHLDVYKRQVYLVDLDKTGVVCSNPDRDGLVEVRAGIIKTKVPLAKLAAPQKQRPAGKQPKYAPRPPRAGGSDSFSEKVQRGANMAVSYTPLDVYKRQTPTCARCTTPCSTCWARRNTRRCWKSS